MPLDGEYASGWEVPLFPSTAFPVGLVSINVSLPWSPKAKLKTELSPPFVANRNLRSGDRMTLPAPSKELGALSCPLIGLKVPEPAPPVAARSTSVTFPFADRWLGLMPFLASLVCTYTWQQRPVI